MKKEALKKYLKDNILFIYFIISNLVNSSILRLIMLDPPHTLKPFLIDLGILLAIGAFSYLLKPKKRNTYYIVWSIFFTIICIVNAHYYGYYTSFVSVSLLATSTFVTEVSDVVIKDVLHIEYFIYIWQLIGLIFLIKLSKKKNILDFLKQEKSKKKFKKTIISSLIVLGVGAVFIKNSEWNRLYNLWNRESVVRAFGIYVYQFDDIIQSLRPGLNDLFGHDNAYKETKDYYELNKKTKIENEYTNIFKDKNVIVIHAESIEKFVMDLSFNNKEVTPNLNKIASEGLYFSNFYSQVGVGTSSDAEFTFSTSLMPSLNGTVFVNYYDRNYLTIQKLLKQQGYNVSSMHANNGDFWNRKIMHKNMGYDMFYDKDYFTIDETIGLGLSDKSFFKQVIPYLQDIKQGNEKFYTTLIMLSNHTPFDDLSLTEEYDTSIEYDVNNQTIIKNPIKGTMLENYIRSVHYADQALGDLINDLEENNLLDNTVLVIYGDHEARIDKEEFDLLYNYNPLTGKLYEKEDENYVDYNKYEHELNKKVPFIIWTKDSKDTNINKEITIPMGMIDVLPTLGNMLGVESKYQLGTDIFSIKNNDNIVVFTDSSYLTSKIYYSSQKSEIYSINNEAVTEEYIKNNSEKADEIIKISNNIINFNLINELETKKSW